MTERRLEVCEKQLIRSYGKDMERVNKVRVSCIVFPFMYSSICYHCIKMIVHYIEVYYC